MIPFQEACLHAKNKLYPCFKQKIAQYFYIVLMLTIGGYVGVSNLFDFHLDLSWHGFIVLAIVVGIYVYLYYKVFRCYGITFLGCVDFDRYAEYIVANYWKNIQYDIKHGLLKNLLLDAKKRETNTLSEILKNITDNNSNSYQKKYVIDCILKISDNENILPYTEKHLIPMTENDNDVIYFLIEKIHLWNINHRHQNNIKLYLLLLEKYKNDYEKTIIYNLINFMNNESDYLQKYRQLRNSGKCDFLNVNQKIRIKIYKEAEENIIKEIDKHYNQQDKMFSDPTEYAVLSEKGSSND